MALLGRLATVIKLQDSTGHQTAEADMAPPQVSLLLADKLSTFSVAYLPA